MTGAPWTLYRWPRRKVAHAVRAERIEDAHRDRHCDLGHHHPGDGRAPASCGVWGPTEPEFEVEAIDGVRVCKWCLESIQGAHRTAEFRVHEALWFIAERIEVVEEHIARGDTIEAWLRQIGEPLDEDRPRELGAEDVELLLRLGL